MIKDRSLIVLLMCCIVFHTYVDAWNNRGRHRITERRRLWQMNDNGPAFSAAGTTKRKWESSKFPNNNRTQIAREKRREWDCSVDIAAQEKENPKKRGIILYLFLCLI